MADTVQYLLEEALPELEDFERKGYFSKSELKAIIQKRQDFEYNLKRRAALKLDYYRYIEYEVKLEQLRRMRKQKLGIQGKKSIAETAIVKRIHFIYERATRKFKSDLQLWLDWLAYCKKSKSPKQHSKVVTKALQRHATAPVLWIEAATWEFERSGNVAAARSLMQQGLRMCKHEEVMWVEYFRMEVLYVQRLRMRREVLGLDLPMEAPTSDADAPSVAPSSESEAAVQAVLTGAVARVVCKNAIAAIPRSLVLRKKMLQVLELFDFPGVRSLEDSVYATIASDFSMNEDAWDLLARRPLVTAAAAAARSQKAAGDIDGAAASRSTMHSVRLEEHNAVLATYERAVQAVKSSRMYDLFAGYLEGRLEGLMKASASTSGATPVASQPARTKKHGRGGAQIAAPDPMDLTAAAGVELLAVFLSAHKERCADAPLYLRWVSWAQRLGQDKMAAAAARHGCERHPASSKLWSQRLALEAEVKPTQALELFRTASHSVSPQESLGLWNQMLELIGVQGAASQQLMDLLVEAAMAAPASSGLGSVLASFLQRIRAAHGPNSARQFYKRFLTLPAAGSELYRAAIKMELAEDGATTSSRCQPKQQRSSSASSHVQRLFEAAVAAHGNDDAQLWLEYAAYEVAENRGAGSVYWRAVKALADPDKFIRVFQEQVQDCMP